MGTMTQATRSTSTNDDELVWGIGYEFSPNLDDENPTWLFAANQQTSYDAAAQQYNAMVQSVAEAIENGYTGIRGLALVSSPPIVWTTVVGFPDVAPETQ